MSMNLEVLHVPDCPNLAPLMARLRAVTDLPVVTREIRTSADAAAAGMAGSPTLLINGTDPFGPVGTGPFDVEGGRDSGISCRIYRDEHGQPVPAPSVGQLRAALAAGQGAQRLVSLIRAQLGLPDLIAHLVRLLASGQPVTVEQVAEAGGWTAGQVRAELARHRGVDWAEDGRVVGFGMTLRPTPHRFTAIGGHTAYGFCASDTLGFPVILGRPGLVDSTCPVTGRHIRVELTPDEVVSIDPPEAVVSRMRPDRAVVDLRAEICALGNFFGSPEAAARWQAQRPGTALVPIGQDFEATRLAVIELGWAAGRT